MKNVREYGRPPFQVAVVHGGPGAPGSAAAPARELGKSFGVLEPLQTATTLRSQIDELHETLQIHSQLPVTLVGHSWGAWLSLLLAAHYPETTGKLILVGCPAFRAEYVQQLTATRLGRLDAAEQAEWQQIVTDLHSPNGTDKDRKTARMGKLAAKADGYSLLPDEQETEDLIKVDGGMYASVWEEAANLRKSGELLKLGKVINCPVVAIHGDYDPSPVAGVREPLTGVLSDFRCTVLPRCGHTPWKERYARDEFFALLQQEIAR